MSYVYFLDMTKFVEERIAGARQALEDSNASASAKQFLEGRTSALSDFHEFLVQNYIPKLPRRIREAYLTGIADSRKKTLDDR
jgi:hypothetical protein